MVLIRCSPCEHLWAQCPQVRGRVKNEGRDPAVLNEIHFEVIGDNSREKIQDPDLPIRPRAEAYTRQLLDST